MTLLQLGLAAVAALLAVSWGLVAYYKWRAARTQGENREIKQEIDRVKQQSAVIKTQLNNQRVRKKMKKTWIAVIVANLLTACQQAEISVTNTACDGFGIIRASRQDSTETLRQIKVHNDTYRAICPEEAKHGAAD